VCVPLVERVFLSTSVFGISRKIGISNRGARKRGLAPISDFPERLDKLQRRVGPVGIACLLLGLFEARALGWTSNCVIWLVEMENICSQETIRKQDGQRRSRLELCLG
jgi:hypothetical protein